MSLANIRTREEARRRLLDQLSAWAAEATADAIKAAKAKSPLAIRFNMTLDQTDVEILLHALRRSA